MTKKNAKQKKHYIDNDKFASHMYDYKEKCIEVEEKWLKEHNKLREDLPDRFKFPHLIYPRVPEYIGECFFLISNKLSNSPSFYSYTFKDEMIADAYEDCLLRIKSFNHKKYDNPFAYFTQICYYAFLRRIKKEDKQRTVKSEMINNSVAYDYFDNVQHNHDDREYANQYLKFLQENTDHVETDAEKDQKKRKVIKKTTKAHQKRLKEQEEQ